MKTSTTKLILTINDQEITVSFDEARSLYEELNKIFSAPTVNIRPTPWEPIPGWPNIDTSKFVD